MPKSNNKNTKKGTTEILLYLQIQQDQTMKHLNPWDLTFDKYSYEEKEKGKTFLLDKSYPEHHHFPD